ncbi:glycosyltransferase [Thermoleptolyngbya sp. C42_A2020_037]|uniref:glycosyltransferase family protein n=1 Tax=Thermoleptolyngbya sp. C42_A2020_037 TaxID=2747799 RepID=UPI0019E08F59|nr:glycosyltransferase [Thermoleptolyngbya sp. C42_A2020_037]MBF2083860.1 glycosyltransferase family 1 protein [Thermoleptolyngbya sp. C42_A2020_037]
MLRPKELFLYGRPAKLSEFKFDESGKDSIIACPRPPKEAVAAGRAIAVPAGEFSVDQVIKQLPPGYQPDIVHISARNLNFKPIGLHRFGCPTVMKLGDTFHWGDGTLSGMVQYCRQLQCDYHWVYQGVQHLHFFAEAGLKNVFWLPGTMAIDPYVPPPSDTKLYDAVFRGSRSEFHVQRSRLISVLEQSGVAIDVASKPYRASLDDYPKAKIVLNCSLNGDLNRRVFEVLMAGGFLLSDRLSPQAGLSQLFQEGTHLECYGDEQELLDKISYYLSHPEEAAQIASAGQQRLLECFSQADIKQKFYRYVLNHEPSPPFTLHHDPRAAVAPCRDLDFLHSRIKLYEIVQELHRINPKISLIYWQGKCKELLADLADLPRLEITYAGDALSEVKDYCARVGVANQICFQHSSSKAQIEQSIYQVVIIDLPNDDVGLSRWAEEAVALTAESGLLLIAHQPMPGLRRKIDGLLKAKGLKPVRLGFPSQTWEPQKPTYLAYQRGESPNIAASAPRLSLQPMSLRVHLIQSVKSLPWFRAGRRLYLATRR